jgi:hypothetical protein
MADEPQSISVPVVWAGVDEVEILYANTFISQWDPTSMGSFIITAGQLTPPALIGTPDQVQEQAEQVSFVPVRAVARLAVTRSKLEELIAILQANLEMFDKQANVTGKDPRDE